MNQQHLIEVNSKKMSGTPVFRGARIPIQNLLTASKRAGTTDHFLDQFPTVSREQVNGILELSKERPAKVKLLLHECVTRHLKRDLTGHEVPTVKDAGFKALKMAIS